MNDHGETPGPSPTRRTVLTGAAAVFAGAGAGAAAAVLLDREDPAPTPSLAAGSVAGGDGGPWHVVAPGGSIQDSIDGGARAIQLGDGEYPVDAPIVPRPGCTIRGIGEATVLTATADIDAVIAIGAGGPIRPRFFGDGL